MESQNESKSSPSSRRMSVAFSTEDDAEFVNRNKARFRRRLQDRWSCKAVGHRYCFARLDGIHVPLSDDAIEAWITALHNGEATLLAPPVTIAPRPSSYVGPSRPSSSESDSATLLEAASKPIAPRIPSFGLSDVSSSRPTSTSSTIQYQRSFRWQASPSLTDLRSLRRRLRESVHSSSSGSSGVPGIGYLSGKTVKWVGVQLLNAADPVVIIVRRRYIHRLVKRIGQISVEKRADWMLKRELTILRAVEDLLELSLEEYDFELRAMAIKEGDSLKSFVRDSICEANSNESVFLSSLAVKAFPLYLLAEARFRKCDSEEVNAFADNLRETILQEPSDIDEDDFLVDELAAQLCAELAYGTLDPSLSWRSEGYKVLCSLYQTPPGKQSLQALGKNGNLIRDLTAAAFSHVPGYLGVLEQGYAVHFFAEYANDVPVLRIHLKAPTGIPLLVNNLIRLEITHQDIIINLYRVISYLSSLPWCITILVRMGICALLVSHLKFRSGEVGVGAARSWCAWYILRTLRNVAIIGDDKARGAVSDATTNVLLEMLPRIAQFVKKFLGDTEGANIRTWMVEIWG